MKLVKTVSALGLALGLMSATFAAENSSSMQITSIDSRFNGFHAVWVNGTVPSQGCTHSDRAIIVSSDTGSDYLKEIALEALTSGKFVTFRVDGCARINPDQSSYTAPKIIRLSISK